MVTRIRLVGLPGTGKTTRLIAEIEQLIKRGYKPSDIIFCSHSNASVREAKERIRDKGFTRLRFTTIHSLAKALVTDHLDCRYISILDATQENQWDTGPNRFNEFLGVLQRKHKKIEQFNKSTDQLINKLTAEFETYFRIKRIQIAEQLCRELAELLSNLSIPPAVKKLSYHDSSDPRIGGVFNDLEHDLFQGLYNLIQIIETAWALEVTESNRKQIGHVLQDVLRTSKQINYLQLTNILLGLQQALNLFREGAYSFNQVLFETLRHKLRPDGKILIIDEYQDIGKLQFELAELWAQEMEIFMVSGDPNQSIYGFNGVSPDFLEEFKADDQINLVKSYRVPPKVIKYAQAVYPNHWTRLMSSQKEEEGKVTHFGLKETVDFLLELDRHKEVFVLSRSDDIKTIVEQEFSTFGIGTILSEDLKLLLSIRSLYSHLQEAIVNKQATRTTIEQFLSQIQGIESETGLKLSQYFNTVDISNWLAETEDETTILTHQDVGLFNLINSPHFTPPVNSKPLSQDSIKFLLHEHQAKRIRIFTSRLQKKVNSRDAGIRDLDRFLKKLKNYESSQNIGITNQLNMEKIDKWKYGIRYRNFMNTLRPVHLERFGIAELITVVNQVDPGRNGTSGSNGSLPTIRFNLVEEYFKHNSNLLSNLTDREREIFENTFGLIDITGKLESLAKNLKFLTMHASKGREADVVIIPSTKTYYEERKITDPEESKRVYFTAVTRTKEHLIIIEDDHFPRSESEYLP